MYSVDYETAGKAKAGPPPGRMPEADMGLQELMDKIDEYERLKITRMDPDLEHDFTEKELAIAKQLQDNFDKKHTARFYFFIVCVFAMMFLFSGGVCEYPRFPTSTSTDTFQVAIVHLYSMVSPTEAVQSSEVVARGINVDLATSVTGTVCSSSARTTYPTPSAPIAARVVDSTVGTESATVTPVSTSVV